ncbi:hypothetical protein L195_g012076 [Trifolium pratense]|uniref:Uncharacterized protein n=1 Tax=Trifolium pratense TaxID=57577 RepID=A0A2K3PJB6_TRIPR|nr:hypothetical protein L195_g012076 [Trifolium pratense]
MCHPEAKGFCSGITTRVGHHFARVMPRGSPVVHASTGISAKQVQTEGHEAYRQGMDILFSFNVAPK